MLTVLTNIRSTKVFWKVEDDLWWKTTLGGEATSKQGRRLRFGILTVLTNIRSTKVLLKSDVPYGFTFISATLCFTEIGLNFQHAL